MKRVVIKSDKIRNNFFEKIRSNYHFNGWKSLYKELSICRSLFDKYRSGSLSLPLKLFNKLKLKLDKKSLKKIEKYGEIIENNWGQIKGGKNAYFFNKEVFNEGRKKGLQKIIKKNFVNTDIPISNKLCYFLGLFMGDGFANKYGTSYLIQFVGHKDSERNFYNLFVNQLLIDLFSIKPKIRIDTKFNAIRMNIYSKDLLEFIYNEFKIPLGKKFDKIVIPSKILNSNPENLMAFTAGLFDAEGCVFLDKRNKYRKPYPRITFHINNKFFTEQIYNLLLKNDIKITNSSNFEMLNIYGKKNIIHFLSKIPLMNDKLLNKLKTIGIYPLKKLI